jgi:hypothetical protein
MTLLLIVLIIVILGGGGYGYRGGYLPEPLGLVLLIVVVFLIVGALGGPRWGWW